MDNNSASANNMWVFRDGKTSVAGQTLRSELEKSVARLWSGTISDRTAIDALLRAGEFESAFADADPTKAYAAERLTNALALCLWHEKPGNPVAEITGALAGVQHLAIPESLRVCPPEGFAYYGLHPQDFAALADAVAANCHSPAAIVGIRSIGTTLSAIVVAAFRRRGIPAQRITVRPEGHPYDRVTRFSPAQISCIETARQRGSKFLVVDEGPGRSGSSFLSVGEGLERAGVPVDEIRFLGSRPIDASQLCASNAAARWNRFQFTWPKPQVYGRFNNDIYIGGGEWRNQLLPFGPAEWPASWLQMERFKFLSADRKKIYKFDGFGRFGEEVLSRAQRLADAGFGPEAQFAGDGMIEYRLVKGRALATSDVNAAVLQRVADYCAFRAKEFRLRKAPPSQLSEMFAFNVQHEFGIEPDLDWSVLFTGNPVLCDGRMQPWEWISSPQGKLFKVDGYTHGDDHFFPGPTDIAWDLAGVITEWDLDNASAEFFLAEFERRTGDDARNRIGVFLLAYSVFRMGYCKMALSSVEGSPDYQRLQRAAGRYRNLALEQLRTAQQSRATQGSNARSYSISLRSSSLRPESAA